jgi:hypothetical protein
MPLQAQNIDPISAAPDQKGRNRECPSASFSSGGIQPRADASTTARSAKCPATGHPSLTRINQAFLEFADQTAMPMK